MTRRQIHEIALRKRPPNRQAYEDIHLALAEELQREPVSFESHVAQIHRRTLGRKIQRTLSFVTGCGIGLFLLWLVGVF